MQDAQCIGHRGHTQCRDTEQGGEWKILSSTRTLPDGHTGDQSLGVAAGGGGGGGIPTGMPSSSMGATDRGSNDKKHLGLHFENFRIIERGPNGLTE